MAQTTTVEYRSDRCSHTNVVEFDSDEDPWEEKTRGCNSCGKTSQFTKVSDEPDSENDVVQDERGDEQESVGGDVEDTEVSLDGRSYTELQKIASHTSVAGNQSQDDLREQLRDVDDSTLESAIADAEVNDNE